MRTYQRLEEEWEGDLVQQAEAEAEFVFPFARQPL